MDIPRIFNITEGAHRIHNPITPEKLAILGAALRLESGARVLDLGSGSGEMLCTWARDHGIIGTGIDMSQLFTEQAKLRSEELGVAGQVKFIHGDAAGYVSDEKVSVAACVGATWIAGGVVGTIESSLASPIGGGYRRRKMLPKDVLPTQSPIFSCFQNFSRLSANLATTSLKWFWLTKTTGIDTRRPNGSPCADGLKPIPTTSSPKMFEPN
jgi:hypothetical protein